MIKMTNKNKKALIKELIIVKKLLNNSKELIKSDSMENNLISIFNLNSALNIFLMGIRRFQKIKSMKDIDKISLEKQWSILSEEYQNRYDQKLSMKTQIFTLYNIIKDFKDYDELPSNKQVHELHQALSVFIDELVTKMFNLDFSELDFHLLLENPQVRKTLKHAQDAFSKGEYTDVLKSASLAFHIALEDQRRKLNYLSEKSLLKPELIMMDKSIRLHINSNEQEFIHLILGTPQKKLEQFKQIAPTTLVSEDENARAEIIISDFVDNAVISQDNAEFCLNFVLETILYWESLKLMRTK